MTDPRTEARTRFAARLYTADAELAGRRRLSEHEAGLLADAVLELFPEIEVEEWGQYADGSWPQPAHSFPNFIEPTHRRLILRGPVEPVVPEEPSRKPIRCPGCDVEEGARHDDGCHGGEWGQYAWQITEESQP